MSKYHQIFVYFVPPKYPLHPFNPPAWNYDNLQGKIWLEGNPSGYDNSHTGKISVREPNGVDALGALQGGCYDNRA